MVKGLLTRRAAVAGIGVVALSACTPATPPVLRKGEFGEQVDLINGGTAWLSRFDLTKSAMDHIALDDGKPNTKPGVYYPSSNSPAFTRLDNSAILKNYQALHGPRAQALINASFFERYDPATELSFPIKRAGVVLTGGSSPYGPCENPTDERYKAVVLKALMWSAQGAKIVDYDHKTGLAFEDAAFPDGLVTYDYRDHPAALVRGDPPNQYQLMGLVAGKDGQIATTFLVLTIFNGTMGEGAVLLRNNGVLGSIITVDGGPSTHLWERSGGAILTTKSTILPHYLGFRALV